jgi:hypothetical protein
LWYALINKDKAILICANKFKTAKDILSRIKMAYEELPQWLKPGIMEWNAASIVFDNGCKISAEATSGSSGRGGSINCLICDEFAFLAPGLEDEFLQSVFPVVSSSKTSKIIIVSTPNGMGNEFYRIWNRAELNLDVDVDDGKPKWKPVKVNWWEVPGRDEKWRDMQLESFGGSISKFEQEYGNNFLGSSETLISGERIKAIREMFKNHLPGKDIQLHKEFKETVIKVYEPPLKNHAYVIGADPSMGTESDYHSMCVWDITNTYDIRQVASFYENNIPPKVFAYILAKTGYLYNRANVAIENNGCSQVVLDALWRDFDYDNIVHEGGNPKTNIGIHSQNARKTEACLNFKLLVEDEKRKIQINDGRLIAEMEKFERKSRLGKMPTYEAADGHDDFMMSSIWGLYVLKMEILERYYDVRKTILNKLGEQIPLYVLPFDDGYSFSDKEIISQMDEKLNNFGGEYQRRLNKIESEINEDFMNNFIKSNEFEEFVNSQIDDEELNKHKYEEDDDFHFRLFMPQ